MVQAVILAAGEGKRLEPFSYTKPKPLIPILDRPLIDYIIENLRNVGVNEILIVVSHLKEKIMQHLSSGEKYNVRIHYIVQEKPLGTAHAIKTIKEYVKPPFIIYYGDVLVSHQYLLKLLNLKSKHHLVILATKTKTPWDYGVLRVEDNNVIDIIEKPEKGKEPSNLINAGVYLADETILKYVNKIHLSPRGEYELTDAIKLMIKNGYSTSYVEVPQSEWFELGKVWDILDINREFLQRKLKQYKNGIIKGDVSSRATIEGPVYIDEGAKVLSGVYIKGPAYIGKNAEIGPNSYIRPYSIIGKNTRIGNACEVKASVIMDHTHAAHLTYIGDSVIGSYVNLGAGTITANLRFDNKTVKVRLKGKRIDSGKRKLGAFIGDYVKTGINVSIMPGVKIGAYSWIAPGAVVYDDIPPRSFYKQVSTVFKVVPLSLKEDNIK